MADVPTVALADAFNLSGEPGPLWSGPDGPADAVIAALTAIIVDAFDPLAVILFGSRARDEATSTSDVDLLVVFDHVANRRAAAVEIRRRLSGAPLPIDILVTTPAENAASSDNSGHVLYHALKDGRVLYDRRS